LAPDDDDDDGVWWRRKAFMMLSELWFEQVVVKLLWNED
jgi:hypothetical protein